MARRGMSLRQPRRRAWHLTALDQLVDEVIGDAEGLGGRGHRQAGAVEGGLRYDVFVANDEGGSFNLITERGRGALIVAVVLSGAAVRAWRARHAA